VTVNAAARRSGRSLAAFGGPPSSGTSRSPAGPHVLEAIGPVLACEAVTTRAPSCTTCADARLAHRLGWPAGGSRAGPARLPGWITTLRVLVTAIARRAVVDLPGTLDPTPPGASTHGWGGPDRRRPDHCRGFWMLGYRGRLPAGFTGNGRRPCAPVPGYLAPWPSNSATDTTATFVSSSRRLPGAGEPLAWLAGRPVLAATRAPRGGLEEARSAGSIHRSHLFSGALLRRRSVSPRACNRVCPARQSSSHPARESPLSSGPGASRPAARRRRGSHHVRAAGSTSPTSWPAKGLYEDGGPPCVSATRVAGVVYAVWEGGRRPGRRHRVSRRRCSAATRLRRRAQRADSIAAPRGPVLRPGRGDSPVNYFHRNGPGS